MGYMYINKIILQEEIVVINVDHQWHFLLTVNSYTVTKPQIYK